MCLSVKQRFLSLSPFSPLKKCLLLHQEKCPLLSVTHHGIFVIPLTRWDLHDCIWEIDWLQVFSEVKVVILINGHIGDDTIGGSKMSPLTLDMFCRL